MEAHQQRVVDEKCDLDGKRDKLVIFIGGPIFIDLTEAEQMRLSRQLAYMDLYSGVLGERISAFTTTE